MPYDITYMWNLKYNTNQHIYETITDSQIKTTGLWLLVGGRGGMEEGMVKEFEMKRNTLLYLKWVTTKNLL